jgi:hypothetical protein
MQLIVRVLNDLQLRLPTSSNTTMADRVWQTMVFLAASRSFSQSALQV